MQKYRVAIIFFFIAAAMGVFLRWQMIAPVSTVNFKYWVHGHSHVMFTGWVFNVLIFAFVDRYLVGKKSVVKMLLIFLQVGVVGMLVAFPVQGYAALSIMFSSVHTVTAMVLIVLFLIYARRTASVPLWFARVSLIFFLVSTMGPFTLGYLSSQELGQSKWYHYAIYYYLHFQYNGCFIFGVVNLFLQWIEDRGLHYNAVQAKHAGYWMLVSCVPAYVLSILYDQPGMIWNLLGGGAALVQIVAFVLLLAALAPALKDFRAVYSKSSLFFLLIVLVSYAIKIVLQLLSALPAMAVMVNEYRAVVIAYLHLVLIGVVTVFLIWWLGQRMLHEKYVRTALWFLLIGFVVSQFMQVLLPWWSQLANVSIALYLLFASSCLLLVSAVTLLVSPIKRNRVKYDVSVIVRSTIR